MRQTEQEFAARFSSKSVWMKRYDRSTTSIISRFISSLNRETPGQGMAPYGLLTVTSE